MKITNGIEMLEISAVLAGGPNVGGASVIHPVLLWDEEDTILVDAGLPGQLPQIRESMEKAGVPFARLSKVIITHHDMDHIGSLSAILHECAAMKLQKVEVLAHEGEIPYIQAEQPPLRMVQIGAQLDAMPEERRGPMKALYENLKANYQNFKANVDKAVSDGEELPCCGGITVIYTPGHTLGHICLYLKRNKTLIAGDAMNVEGGLLVSAPLFTLYDKDLAAKSLKKLTQYDIETVICFHGGIYKDNPNQRIAELAGN